MSMVARAGTLARKTRRRSGGLGYRHGTRYHHHHHNHHHQKGDPRSRRASAPILSPHSPRLVRIPSPISRSAETVALPIPSPSPGGTSPAASPSKSVSFSTEVEEVLIPRPDTLSVHTSLTPPPCDKPLYESTVVWAELDEGDTHYSVVASLSEAGNEARHPCDFIHRSMFILSGTWPVTVFLLILLALPLVMTTIGVNYLHECPREPKLPIYLVVGGCFGILKLLFLLWKQIRRHRDDVLDLHDDEDLLTMTRMTNMALNVFLSVWFVFGHYWLIRIWEPHFEAPLHEPRNWCDRTVFTFTFWQLVICHVILGILILVAMVLYCCYICIKCGPNSGNESLVGLDSSSVVRDASRVDAHGEKKNNDVTVMDSHGDTDDCVTNMDAKTPLGFQRPPPKR